MTPHTPEPTPNIDFDLNAAKQIFLDEDLIEKTDPIYNRIVENLDAALQQHEEEFGREGNHFLFDHAAFIDSLDHVIADQQSTLKKEKLTPKEWSLRFNRWIVFCETVVNMGITCIYSKDALAKEDYATVFNTLSISKIFETTFLKPRGIKIELVHKNDTVKEKYPWLAMPCLIIKDDEGQVHHIALTPGPEARVWWLDTLANFHESFNWEFQGHMDEEGLVTTMDQPYAPLERVEDQEDNPFNIADDDDDSEADKDFIETAAQHTAAEEFTTRFTEINPNEWKYKNIPANYASRPEPEPVVKRQGFFSKLFAAIGKLFK